LSPTGPSQLGKDGYDVQAQVVRKDSCEASDWLVHRVQAPLPPIQTI
jgi:hypothetical protein